MPRTKVTKRIKKTHPAPPKRSRFVDRTKPQPKPPRTPKPLVKARQAQILDLYSRGKTVPQIAVMMGMHQQVVTHDLNYAIDEMTRMYATATPHSNFCRYAAFQYSVINKLQSAHDLFMYESQTPPAATGKKEPPRQFNAAISALRAQSEILDRIYDKGKEFGIIQHKKASDSTRKKPQDLRNDIRQEIDKLSDLLNVIDDQTQAASIRVRQTSITCTVRVRKPRRNQFGIVSALPDWKYRQRVAVEKDGKIIETPLHEVRPTDTVKPVPESQLRKLRVLLNQERRQQETQQETPADTQETHTAQPSQVPASPAKRLPAHQASQEQPVKFLVQPTMKQDPPK